MSVEQVSRQAAIYVRISKVQAIKRSGVAATDEEREAGVARQEELCRELGAKLGWDIVEVYADNDFEASSGKPRPAYLRMLDDIRAGKINAVLGWHSDRIYRRPDELEDLIKIADAHDVKFAAVIVGNIDLSTASGRLVARMLGAAAKYETELKGERQSAQLRQLAHAGRTTGGGSRMFGYADSRRTTIDEREAAVIREAASRALAGESVNAVTNWIENSGIPTISGKPWQPAVVKRMLANPAIAGIATWKGEVVGKAEWPPIIDEQTHLDLVARLATTAKHRPGPRVAYLQGLVWCESCEYELVTAQVRRAKTDPQVRAYSCRTRWLAGRPGYGKACGGITVKAEWLEDDVAEQMIARLSKPAARALMSAVGSPTVDSDNAVRETIEIDEKLTQLGLDYADDLIGRTEFIAARERLAARLAAIKERASVKPALPLPYGDLVAMVAWWDSASVAQRLALARQQIDKITIGHHSGRRSEYDPSRVSIVWR